MAEILLSGVLRKLAEFTVEKVLQLCGVNEAVENLKSLKDIVNEAEKLKKELSYIQKFIEDADKRCIVDETQKQWVMDLIETANQIEDALDIFYLECPTAVDDGIKSVSKKKLRLSCLGHCCEKKINIPIKILRLPFLLEFQKEMKNIMENFAEIHANGEKYKTQKLGKVFSAQNIRSSGHKLDPIGDPEVIGFDKDMKNVVNKLCDENVKMLAVVSIVGPGGIGKTTLASKMCHSKEVTSKFGKPAWATISQMYDLFEVLKKIAKNFDLKPGNLDVNELANKIREHLEQRKYLIVLDDVWTKELCDELLMKGVLHDNKFSGSRVLITTRNIEVARYVRKTYEPYELNFLNPDESLELFLKNAIPENHQCSEQLISKLHGLSKEFIVKCKGLPLALVVLGRLLSTKDCNYHKWKELLETMSWQDEKLDECSKIMATSYDHLPFARKLCFMYFAAFPEDRKIDVESLLRMWIAEGFIPTVERKTLEQTAMGFLEDLVHRSMVQVDSRNEVDGSILYVRVHDILRDLAIKKAKEGNFLVVCSEQADWNLEHCRKARRVAVHYSNFSKHIQQYASSNLRSLLTFGGDSILDCSKYRLLRVLAQVGWEWNDDKVLKMQSFTRLPHLRYLRFRPQEDYEYEFESELSKWLEAMESLETLDCRGGSYYVHRIWKIKTLRHFSLYSISTYDWIDGPPASAILPNLQTLKYVRASPTWGTSQLPTIPKLRELIIRVERRSLDVIAALLGKLIHLVFLEMGCESDIQIQSFEGVFRFLEKLKYMSIIQEIYVDSFSALELKDNMLPPNLIKLDLSNFEFKSDPMPVLEKLSSLKILKICLSNREYHLKIKCSAGGFKQLEELTLLDISMLHVWEIELGAMPLLKRLEVISCDQLPVPQTKWFIDHKSLRYMSWDKDWETTDLQHENKLNEIFKARPDLIPRM